MGCEYKGGVHMEGGKEDMKNNLISAAFARESYVGECKNAL